MTKGDESIANLDICGRFCGSCPTYANQLKTGKPALLSLGVKDITFGPKLPGFVSPAVLDVLVKNFDLKPNTTVQADLARMVKA